MRIAIAIAGVIAGAMAVMAQPKPSQLCQNANSQMEMNQCMDLAYRAADKELNDLYGKLKGTRKPEDLATLQAAQRAWMKYRDANCAAESSLYAGGSILPTIRAACLEKNTRDRIAELRRIYESPDH